jgi:aspartate aminotransferase
MGQIMLADRMVRMNESATLALNARAKQLAAEGKTIYNLTAGELGTDTPDYIQKDVAKTLHLNKYTAVAGTNELREQIAAQARDFYGLDWIQASNVVVTAGTKAAIMTSLLAVINPGDEVILPTPVWTTYNQQVELAGGVVVEVPLTSEFDLDVPAVQAALTPKTKLILINSPHNPTGAVFSRVALEALATALKGTDVIVLSDDIYAKLLYTNDFTLVPTVGFDKIIINNGFSKSQALTGWRVGYVVAETAVARAIASLQSQMSGNAAVPSQQAALSALARGDQPPQATLDTLAKQRQMVDDALRDLPGLSYHLPNGAFYFFLDVRQLTASSADWCEALLDHAGVVLVPGEAFDTPGYARLTFSGDEVVLATALNQLQQFITQGGK